MYNLTMIPNCKRKGYSSFIFSEMLIYSTYSINGFRYFYCVRARLAYYLYSEAIFFSIHTLREIQEKEEILQVYP